MEIEVPAEEPRAFSHIKRQHAHALELETVLMTIYYPAALGSGTGEAPDGGKHWSRETWIPRPRISQSHGYGKFGGIGWLGLPFFASTTMFTKLPAFRNARPATHWPPHEDLTSAGVRAKNEEGRPPHGGPKMPKFPLMIFSHGLGGNRTMYSSLCGEFASYGFVVIAVEHRDGSGTRTFVNHNPEGEGSMEEREKKGDLEHTQSHKERGYGKIDYMYPLNNAADTSPNNEKGVDHELRDAQLQLRCAEILEAYRVISAIAEGNGNHIAQRNMKTKGYVGGSSRGLAGVDWGAWNNRIDLKHVTMTGHSFGAATTISVLRNVTTFSWVTQGIIYDIWAAGLHMPSPDESADNKLQVPILAINSEAFTYWRSNLDVVKDLVKEARNNDALAWLMTVRGTVHVNQSDLSILYPTICGLALKMTANPQRALDLNINASLEFLKLVLPDNLAEILHSMQDEKLLQMAVTDRSEVDEDDIREPDQEWLAARLAMPHELSYRLDPRRRAERKKKQKKAEERIHEGVACEEEVWMIMAPDPEMLVRHSHGALRAMQSRDDN